MATEIVTCACADCSHELQADCINMQCACCMEQDVEDMLTRGGG